MYLLQGPSSWLSLSACLPTRESILQYVLLLPVSTLHSKVNSWGQSCLGRTVWITKTISSHDLFKGCMEFLTGKFGRASWGSSGMRPQDCSLVRSLSPVVGGLGKVAGAMREGRDSAADQASPKVGNGCRRRTLPLWKWRNEETHMWRCGCWKRKIFAWSAGLTSLSCCPGGLAGISTVCTVPCYGTQGVSKGCDLLHGTTNDLASFPLDTVLTLFRHR